MKSVGDEEVIGSIQAVQPKNGARRPAKTASQSAVEGSLAGTPGWTVTRRTMATDGTFKMACRIGEVAIDVRVGRGGARTVELRDPGALLEAAVIASLIQTRSEVIAHG